MSCEVESVERGEEVKERKGGGREEVNCERR